MSTDKRAFFLVFTSSVGPQIYDLVAGSRDEKNKWCKYITDAVETHRASNQTPVYDDLTLPSRLSKLSKSPSVMPPGGRGGALTPAGGEEGSKGAARPPNSSPSQ